ncbi:diphthamide biosynthesis protein 4 [Paecilomyces variotii No. 5]|uniref:Diphthamide biosynthesis protein 4 n=1 Tax=Byssochlamys spectabilis (strain No. 5 / NBRC 109023) TaxID=1356009 RepID=V5GBC8_BYSSN|nr:diphthamide biosynthesis protein 4 [Paecilomyces variotii No. 5]
MIPSSVEQDFYAILDLPFTGASTPFSKQQIKVAYHRALLKYHPDKAPAAAGSVATTASTDRSRAETYTYTVDEITTAYKTLSDPFLRTDYDRSLRLSRLKAGEKHGNADVFHTGLEVVDLEDLGYEEVDDNNDGHEADSEGSYWYRSCRCGDEKGFLVTEQDLEREAEHGEIIIGCRGCSLWMKILFAVEADDDNDVEEKGNT